MLRVGGRQGNNLKLSLGSIVGEATVCVSSEVAEGSTKMPPAPDFLTAAEGLSPFLAFSKGIASPGILSLGFS